MSLRFNGLRTKGTALPLQGIFKQLFGGFSMQRLETKMEPTLEGSRLS